MMGAAVGALGAVDTALFAAQDIIEPALGGVVDDALTRGVGDLRREEASRLKEIMRLQRLREAKQANLERLARMHPDVYNQVAAGRRLPKGAFVIGGTPDVDALDQVTTMMAEGRM